MNRKQDSDDPYLEPRIRPVRQLRPVRHSSAISDTHIRRQTRKLSRSRRLLIAAILLLRQVLIRRPFRLALQAALVLLLITIVLAAWQAGPGSALAAGQSEAPALSATAGSVQTALAAGTSDAAPTSDTMTASGSVYAMTASASASASSSVAATAVSTSANASSVTAVTAATTISTSKPATATSKATIAYTVIPTATTFKGIEQAISDRWVFPLKLEPFTPTIGVFGASRTSSRLHAGIDLYAASGTPVYAMTAGKVQDVLVFYESLMAVDVANADGTTIRYGELTPAVAIGDSIAQGQLIGKLRSNSDHTCMLHLEIYATVNIAPLTDTANKNDYPYVPVGSRSYRRRRDLVDPSAVWSLARLDP